MKNSKLLAVLSLQIFLTFNAIITESQPEKSILKLLGEAYITLI